MSVSTSATWKQDGGWSPSFSKGRSSSIPTLGPPNQEADGMSWEEDQRAAGAAGRVRYQSDTPKAINHLWPFSLAPWTSHFSWTTLFCHLLLLCLLCHPPSLSPKARKKYIHVIKGFPKAIGLFPLGYQYFMKCYCSWSGQHPCSTLNTSRGAGSAKSLLFNVLRSLHPVSFIPIAHSRPSSMFLSASRDKASEESRRAAQYPTEFPHTVG